MINILAFAGSLRKSSLNRALLNNAVELCPEGMNMRIYSLDGLPLYNEDIEKEGVPAVVQEFRNAIREADGLLIAVPEYNYSLPGVLKNAIDWASRPVADSSLSAKPAGIAGVSGGTSGTAKSQMHFRQIAVVTNMHVMNRPEFLMQKGNEKFDAEGRLNDEITREHFRKFLEALKNWVIKMK